MTNYAVDTSSGTLIRTWSTGRGLFAAVVSELPPNTRTEEGLALAAELTGLSAALWRSYTHPANATVSQGEGSEGWRRQLEREGFEKVPQNLLDPHLPDADGAVLTSYDPIQEHSHRAGRALYALNDEELSDTVREDVEAEIAAVELAEQGALSGRAQQAVALSRADANPLHVTAASAVLQKNPLEQQLLFETFDPTAAAVAAAHWLKAAVDVVVAVSDLDPADVLPTADDIEKVPYQAPAEVLNLLEFSNTVYRVIVEMIADAMLVADGIVSDLETILFQREDDDADEDDSADDDDDGPTPVRVTMLDPIRPAPDLLEDLLSAITACRLLYAEYVDGEPADIEARFCAEVRAEAEAHADRLV
ncbi:hypothetical protein AB0M02_18045 [Actinoplanes sp. NPDC051861]|uniref:hypothetical protein n=1 Tax=Actinoplanes sp. NPDC051861 TaxID=3155170 RepID=UPI00342EC1F9